MSSDYYNFDPYVSVAQRRAKAEKKLAVLRKQGQEITPIEAYRGLKIAKSFWGHAWCRHLESYSDYENRLPRGRTYVRNGSVCHLRITSGAIEALVVGSELYKITIKISKLPAAKWDALKKRCAGKIGSLIELLQGKLSDEVMKVVTDKDDGLFPSPKEIRLDCNCPDHADLCKHLAAVLYGVGVRLDDQPELLFLLRGVDQTELTETDLSQTLGQTGPSKRRRLATTDLSNIFGVEVDSEPAPASSPNPSPSPAPLKRPDSPKPPPPARKPLAKKKAATKKPPAPASSPKTGADIRKLRRRFGMTEYEFSIILDVKVSTVENWESKGKAPHGARSKNQEELDVVAQLSKTAAWDRLDEYL